MAQLFEFAGNHPYLIAAAIGLLGLIIYTELQQSGSAKPLSPADAVRLGNKGALFVDVRPKADYDAGHILNARNLPLDELASRTEEIKKYREKAVIVCCEAGLQSGKAASILEKNGFTHIARLRGGLRQWRQDNLPLVRHD